MPILGKDFQAGVSKLVYLTKATIETQFPGYWNPTEACLSTYSLHKIKDVSNCFFLTFIGNPSSKKTTMLSWFENFPHSYLSDNFTPSSFVSHYAGATENNLKEIDLLPKVKGKVLLTPELMPIYSQSAEVLKSNIGIITRVLDGHGYTSESGVHGQRGYKGVEGSWVFHWLAAVAYVPYPVWKAFGNMGPRAYYYVMPKGKKKTAEELADESKEDFPLKSGICRSAINDILSKLWQTLPEPVIWEKDNDSREATIIIARLAMLLTKLRGEIEFLYESDEYESEDVYTNPIIEEPPRANQVLYNIARGHALFYGRKYITMDDIPLVTKVAINSARPDRVNLFKFLLDKNGSAKSKDFASFMEVSPKIAIRTMKTLRILGLVDLKKENPGPAGGHPAFVAVLKDDFKWFLSQEFKLYWRC